MEIVELESGSVQVLRVSSFHLHFYSCPFPRWSIPNYTQTTSSRQLLTTQTSHNQRCLKKQINKKRLLAQTQKVRLKSSFLIEHCKNIPSVNHVATVQIMHMLRVTVLSVINCKLVMVRHRWSPEFVWHKSLWNSLAFWSHHTLTSTLQSNA